MTEEAKTQEEVKQEEVVVDNTVEQDVVEDTTAADEVAKDKKKKKDKNIKIKESEYNQLVADAAEYKDKYVRLFAEFDNARKRMDREKIDFIKYANEELLTEFLELFDNLELSLQSAIQKNDKDDALIKGIEMVLTQAGEILKKNGVTPIEAKGKAFDPHAHEILLQEETDECEENTVLEELQKGYRIGDKVIRTVKVKISAKKSK